MMTAFSGLLETIAYLTRRKKTKIEDGKKDTPNLTRNEDEKSYIKFTFEEGLEVVVQSNVSQKVVESMIKEGFLVDGMKEDETAIMLATVLMANVVTEQIINKAEEGEYD